MQTIEEYKTVLEMFAIVIAIVGGLYGTYRKLYPNIINLITYIKGFRNRRLSMLEQKACLLMQEAKYSDDNLSMHIRFDKVRKVKKIASKLIRSNNKIIQREGKQYLGKANYFLAKRKGITDDRMALYFAIQAGNYFDENNDHLSAGEAHQLTANLYIVHKSLRNIAQAKKYYSKAKRSYSLGYHLMGVEKINNEIISNNRIYGLDL